ncbi:hypothetical protein ADIWIN_0373 [Winogradskyella psychrotolerans RS-3]|uniref:Uncharacterized protein n=1 Tax=Winogradskyella psychrotolerans RS-3 TaxID=641526 RepID=S7VWY0_9FLAO|nr:hypothetical protein ADIWIN_0373 [Winogradskyella psychrotolerans RS-3]
MILLEHKSHNFRIKIKSRNEFSAKIIGFKFKKQLIYGNLKGKKHFAIIRFFFESKWL